MKSIKQILETKKKRPLACVGSADTVQSAIDMMKEIDVGAVLVIDNSTLVGIFTERDCVQKVLANKLDTEKTHIRDVMTGKVRFVTPDQSASECLALMTERFFRHLPVLDKDQKVLGILSIGDLVKEEISEQKFIIGQLEQYITS